MAAANFVYDGDTIDYTPSGSDVALGDVVVIGDFVCVARRPILDGQTGALWVVGVYAFPKGVTSADVFTVGTKLYWNDSSNIVSTSSGAGKYIGKVAKAAAQTDTTVQVRMGQA